MTEETTIERDEVARKNTNELVRLMNEHNLFIPARDFPNWRPTARDSGDIPGVIEGVEIIATDGILGYFLDYYGNTFIGHIQKFSGKVKTMFKTTKTAQALAQRRDRTGKARKPRVPSRRRLLLDSL